ncbi:nitrogen fixation protein NifQ [Ectothiorhodospira lacustris]|uniref:nitrogen fixation protein NifQ n=1 Tax=Ectothiorhodospira lacustris TaxID=2899127 RepID=UPI001EE962D3|nr:nitrogen fixation protein NifQ [Ectothiorhodospira lacustris]MCG5500599.1 nitrogen fixation protein NifQ [Ectothiorhodospira lacustris]MCG5510482.1 nitrogen fixation protein NifQ [Ectothiorhodospira lacustris]MCG5522228.1 nitrogen fixation protein NifQ [Ectothiorhodospira lacustris]
MTPNMAASYCETPVAVGTVHWKKIPHGHRHTTGRPLIHGRDAPVADGPEGRADTLHDRVLAHTGGLPNDGLLACLLSAWVGGRSVLPVHMGLSGSEYRQLLGRHFPGLMLNPPALEPVEVQRMDERRELRELLLSHRRGQDPSEVWLAGIVAAACMGPDHLWQDLGLQSRDQLSWLMRDNFPGLVELNDRDMKWKKFLYRQLCLAEGILICRSPSCEVCQDHAVCFGPEV